MTTALIGIPHGVNVAQAARTLVDNKLSGAPVLDKDGHLVGIISEYQLLELVYNPALTTKPIKDLMTSDVITVDVNDSIDHVTSLLVLHRIRRVPVMENDRLVGIVTRGDLLRWRIENSDCCPGRLDVDVAPVSDKA